MAVIEACVESLTQVLQAEATGADRVELCTDLSVGGLSPSVALVETCLTHRKGIPIFAMVRPRAGDFTYSISEYHEMEATIREFKALGIEGVVFGGLLSDGSVDITAMQQLLEAASPMQTTFHRAFDEAINPLKTLDQLIELGFGRVLTSGQQPTAIQGADLLKQLVTHAADRIIILAGSGINRENMAALVEQTGVKEIHGTAFCK